MMPMAVPGLVFGLAYIVLAQRLPRYRCHPQRRGVLVVVRPDGPQPVPMVTLATPARSRTSALSHRVRVVESHQDQAVGRVQRQRVAQSVRPFLGHLGLQYDELHPMSGLVHEQRLAVKVGQRVQPGVPVRRYHQRWLSISDNKEKADTKGSDHPTCG